MGYDSCFLQLKSKFLLNPQQKDKKNVQMCVQVGGNSFLAIQTGLVNIGDKDIQVLATKYLGFVQQKKKRELADLFNPNIRGNFIKDEAYAGTMVNHVNAACASNLMFGPWMEKQARFAALPGLGGTFSVTTGLCCIEDNKDRPVAFTHLFWMNDKKKICVDVFRLNLG